MTTLIAASILAVTIIAAGIHEKCQTRNKRSSDNLDRLRAQMRRMT